MAWVGRLGDGFARLSGIAPTLWALVPLAGALTTVFVYAGSQAGTSGQSVESARTRAFFIGVLVTLLLAIFAAICSSAGTAEEANSHNYLHLMNRVRILGKRIAVAASGWTTLPPSARAAAARLAPASPLAAAAAARAVAAVTPADPASREAYQEASAALEEVNKAIKHMGPDWALGTGYTGAWDLINRAEAALIECRPCMDADAVVAEARYNIDRIKNSGIDNEDGLLNQLRQAIVLLDPTAAVYLDQPPLASVSGQQTNERLARAIVREVRQSLDKFRQGQYEGMVGARNRTLRTVMMTGLVAYALVILGIVVGANAHSVATAVGLAIFGTLVAAFGRLYNQAKVKTEIDDFGLTGAQALAVMVYAGIAAVVGVLITVTLYRGLVYTALVTPQPTPTPTPINSPTSTPAPTASPSPTTAPGTPSPSPAGTPSPTARQTVQILVSRASTPTATPTATPTPTTTVGPSQGSGGSATSNQTQAQVPSIDDVFNLDKTPLAPIIAAIFGLVPGLLLTTLREQAARFQTNLLNTEATTAQDGG